MCGVSSNQYQVEWKAGNQIVVTVQADDAYMSTILEDANSEDPDDEDDFIGGDFVNDDEIVDNEDGIDFQDASEDGAFVDTSDESESPDDWNGDISTTGTTTEESKEEASAGIDLVVFARAINAAFNDNGGIGSAIAARFAVEVTTPGGTDTLTTPKMFLAYQGFDIITTHRDPKTKSVKIIEARLVERNSDFLVLNIKGRVKKLKRSDVLSVKLPKAKKEKGVS